MTEFRYMLTEGLGFNSDFERFLGSIPTFDHFLTKKECNGIILRASDPPTLVFNFMMVMDFIFGLVA